MDIVGAESNQFPETVHVDHMNIRDRDKRKPSLSRHSVRNNNSTSQKSRGKLVWMQNDGTRTTDPHEPQLTNMGQYIFPSQRKHDFDTKSDSHGYGTWHSRYHPQDHYLETGSIPRHLGNTSARGWYNEESQGYQQHELNAPGFIHGQGNNLYGNNLYGNNLYRQSSNKPYRSSVSSEATTSDIVYIPYQHRNQQGSKTHQRSDSNTSADQFHKQRDNHVCHRIVGTDNGCQHSSLQMQHEWHGEHPWSQDERNIHCNEYSYCPGCRMNTSFTPESGSNSPMIQRKYASQRDPGSQLTQQDPTRHRKNQHISQAPRESCSRDQPCFHRYHDTGSPHVYKNDPMLSTQLSDIHNSSRSHISSLQGRQLSEKVRSESGEIENFGQSNQHFLEFDHVLETKNFPHFERKESGRIININGTKRSVINKNMQQKIHFHDDFDKEKQITAKLTRSRSVDSLMDESVRNAVVDANVGCQSCQNDPVGNARSHATSPTRRRFKSAHDESDDQNVDCGQYGSDIFLLGVCNQLETMLNKDLLQPVIAHPRQRSQSFSERTGRKTTDARKKKQIAEFPEDRVNTAVLEGQTKLPGLEYSQPQTFTVSSEGGQFVSSDRSRVEVNIPPHAVTRELRITVQLLFISPAAIKKVRELNYFVNNIIATGPVVYFHTAGEANLNSPATTTIPAPAAVKGGHLIVLKLRRDNSCTPCSSGYKSGKLSATFTSWHFTGTVAVLTRARCKYKACKSMEQLLQCVGAAQI